MEKLSKSLLATATVALLSVGFLTGCGSDNSDSTPQGAQTGDNNASITQEQSYETEESSGDSLSQGLSAGEEVDPQEFLKYIGDKHRALDTFRFVRENIVEAEEDTQSTVTDLLVDQRDPSLKKSSGTLDIAGDTAQMRAIGEEGWILLKGQDQWFPIDKNQLIDTDPTNWMTGAQKVVYDGVDDTDGAKHRYLLTTAQGEELTIWLDADDYLIRIYSQQAIDSQGVKATVKSTTKLTEFNQSVEIEKPENIAVNP